MNFEIQLRLWYSENKRSLPWRKTKNPYNIWLSEVIMQQTRIAQGTKYYHHFISTYPTVKDLANAPLDAVLKSWEGLGYYSRARNLHLAANQIVTLFHGNFPKDYSTLLSIKGIGPYTAAAISSICFKEEIAVVDGNVYRVLSRIYGIETPINSSAGIKQFNQLAQKLIKGCPLPGDYNQAIMEYGALHCTPKNPKCNTCIFSSTCVAYNTNTVEKLPVKTKAKPVKDRFLSYLILFKDNKIAVEKRTHKDIWQGLFQFPLIETENGNATVLKGTKMAEPVKHLLSHQRLHITFWQIKHPEQLPKTTYHWVDVDMLQTLAFPIVLKRFIDANLLHL